MKKQYTPYVNAVTGMKIPVYDRARVIAYAVAQAVACNMQIPSAPVSSAEEYYSATVRSQVLNLISKFNEHAVLNAAMAVDYTRSFWLMRYDASAKCPVRTRESSSFFHSFFGVYDYFTPDDIAFLDEHSEVIFSIYTAVCDVLTEALDTRIQNETAIIG